MSDEFYEFLSNKKISKIELLKYSIKFLLKKESNTSWREMYKVFNMGHRMELYVKKNVANEIIAIANSFDLDAQIVGHVMRSDSKKLTIESPEGLIIY